VRRPKHVALCVSVPVGHDSSEAPRTSVQAIDQQVDQIAHAAGKALGSLWTGIGGAVNTTYQAASSVAGQLEQAAISAANNNSKRSPWCGFLRERVDAKRTRPWLGSAQLARKHWRVRFTKLGAGCELIGAMQAGPQPRRAFYEGLCGNPGAATRRVARGRVASCGPAGLASNVRRCIVRAALQAVPGPSIY
jgi:hypothetical protein